MAEGGSVSVPALFFLACFSHDPLSHRLVTLVLTLRSTAAAPAVDVTAADAAPATPAAAAAAQHLKVVVDALSLSAAGLDSRRHEALLTQVLAVGAWGVDQVRELKRAEMEGRNG